MRNTRLLRIVSNYNFWVLACFFFSLSFAQIYRFSDPVKKHNVVISDAKGYYAYFAGAFIHGDMNFKFNQTVELKDHPETRYTDYRYKVNREKIYTKYYVGTAVAYTPVLLLAHWISQINGWQSDGYTTWYHSAVVIASLLYLLIALFFIGKVLDHFEVSHWAKILSVVVMYLGTNWFYYTTWESGMSHSYSVAVMAFFLYYFIRVHSILKLRNALILGLLLGFITLLRPSNLFIVAFIPIVFKSWSAFLKFFTQKILSIKVILLGLLGFLVVISIQFIIYKIQIDEWYIYGYIGETFDFSNTHFLDFLFSIRKGFFVYTPIMIFSIIGMIKWYSKARFQSIYWLVVMFVHTYILSSWHMWWYGGTLGTRVMVEYYLFWLIPMGIFLSEVKRIHLTWIIPIFICLGFYGHLQIHQYILGLLHWDSMTWELYKDIFLYPLIPYNTF